MKVKIKKSELKGTISAPPSKSFAHRMLICAALSGKKSSISGINDSEDMKATLDCLREAGFVFELNNGVCTFNGEFNKKENPVFNCRESGSTLRFMIPVALLLYDNPVFIGTKRLIQRGIDVYVDIFREKNIDIITYENRIEIKGKLTPGNYEIKGNISSQYITGLLMTLPVLEGDSTLKIIPPVESKAYIDITLEVLKNFGIIIEKLSENDYYIKGNQRYNSGNYSVEGDWSNAAFFEAFKSLDNDIIVTGLNKNSVQGDRICIDYFNGLESSDFTADITDCPDLGPVLFALAAAKNGAFFTGTKRLRIKESDRAEAMAQELNKFGIKTVIQDNSVEILKGEIHAPSDELDSHNDHRIVMALTVLLSITGGTINGIEAVNKSYPSFFEDMQSLGLEVKYEN